MEFLDPEDLLENTFPIEVQIQLYNVFVHALKAYNEFIQKSKDFVDTDSFSNLKGYIIRYAIERQFVKESQSENFPFETGFEVLHSRNHKVLLLQRDNIIATIAKTDEGDKLTTPRDYQIEFSYNNRFFNRQLSFIKPCTIEPEICEIPYYCIISYGIAFNELTRLNIIMPSVGCKSCLYKIHVRENVLQHGGVIKENEHLIKSLSDEIIKRYVFREKNNR